MKRLLICTIILFSAGNMFGSGFYKIAAPSGLSLRSSPGVEAPKILVIPYGSRVQVVEKSDKSELIEGKKGVWVKIQWLQYSGWVFDGYLTGVSPDDPVIQYIRFLDSLKQDEPVSVSLAKDKLRKVFLNNKEDFEHAFRLYHQFHQSVVGNINKVIGHEGILSRSGYFIHRDEFIRIDPVNISEDDLDALNKLDETMFRNWKSKKGEFTEDSVRFIYAVLSNGMRLESSEGFTWAAMDFKFISEQVLRDSSGALFQYYQLLGQIDNKVIAADAGFRIDWEELRRQIILAENVYRKYPWSFEFRYNVSYLFSYRFRGYLMGLDNTPVIDAPSGRIVSSVRNSYCNFIVENKDSLFHPYMKKLYLMYVENDFQTSPAIKAYIQKLYTGYEKILKSQPID